VATTTYTALLTRIADQAVRGDIDALIPDWIGDFEAKANRWMRERRMQVRDTASISDEFSAVPADYAEAMTISLTDGVTTWELVPAAPETMENYAQQAQTGRPRFFAIVGPEVRYYPAPDAAYTATFNYFSKLEAISGSNATNWLLTDAPDAYVQGVMAGFHEWDQNFPASDRAMAKAEQIFTELMMARRTPVGPLRTEVAQVQRPRSYSIYRDF